MCIPVWPTKPETDEMFTMAPPPACSIIGIACFMPRKTPLALTSIRRSHADVLSVSGSKVPLMPALLTRTSSLPKSLRVASIAFCQAGSLVTSRWTKRPAPPRLSATRRPSASSTSATTTFAPSLAKMTASLWPMPLAPPVISATFPPSLIACPFPWDQNRWRASLGRGMRHVRLDGLFERERRQLEERLAADRAVLEVAVRAVDPVAGVGVEDHLPLDAQVADHAGGHVLRDPVGALHAPELRHD